MSVRNFVINAGIIFVMIVLSGPANSRSISGNPVSMRDYPYAWVWVDSEKAAAYKNPSKKSALIDEYLWMDKLKIDQGQIAKAPTGWIPIVYGSAESSIKHNNLSVVWVRLEDVVTGNNFSKVTGCWPIKHLYFEAGDYSADFFFNSNGRGRVYEYLDDSISNSKQLPYEPLQVYVDSKVVKLAPTRKEYPRKVFVFGAFNPKNKMFYVDGVPADKQELFSDEELKGCGRMPQIK